MDGLGLDIIEAVIAQEYNVILIDLMSYTNELPRKPHNKRIRMKNPVGAKSPHKMYNFIILFVFLPCL